VGIPEEQPEYVEPPGFEVLTLVHDQRVELPAFRHGLRDHALLDLLPEARIGFHCLEIDLVAALLQEVRAQSVKSRDAPSLANDMLHPLAERPVEAGQKRPAPRSSERSKKCRATIALPAARRAADA